MFGGGYSMLPLLIRELVDKKRWCTEEEILDYFSLAQCTPGIIAINAATFVGYKQKKVWGGIVASIGVVTIPILIITIVAAILKNLMEYALVQHLFAGIRIAVAALMAITILRLIKKAGKDGVSYGIIAVSFLLLTVTQLNSVWLILLAACFGIGYGRWQRRD